MYRVTGNSMKNDLVFNLQSNMQAMDRMHNNLATGKKVRVPREEPVAATHAMLYRTRITQIQQYVQNIDEGSERLTIADSALMSTTDILQRFQELAVQAANGVYTDEDRAKMAVEVDELLKQMLQIGNSKYKGESVFSGHRTDMDPFLATTGRPAWSDREVVMAVQYRGDIGQQNREIEEGEYMSVNLTGNSAFMTNNQLLVSTTDVTTWTATADSRIRIDGKVIQIAAGDNVDAVIAKMNTADLPIWASRTGFNREGIQITTTSPHELWMEDIEGGQVLQQLGLADRGLAPNQAPSGASRSGLTIFDMAIQLRDDLWQGRVREIGGRDIAMIQSSLDNVLKNNAEVGARVHRLETVKLRLEHDETSMTDILAKTENIDFPETIMNLKMLEYVHQSALASGARILKPTLIDYLR
jgi:flagellar hook-associated protein 3 FlgL